MTALTTGVTPEGRKLAPAMPYDAYANLTKSDARAIAAYLQSLPPVSHQVAGPFVAEGNTDHIRDDDRAGRGLRPHGQSAAAGTAARSCTRTRTNASAPGCGGATTGGTKPQSKSRNPA